MASSAHISAATRRRWRRILSWEGLIVVWIPLIAISGFHYGTPHEYHWVHDILRRAYYLPIVIAAMRSGLLGGLVTASVVVATYLPHAFLADQRFDPGKGIEKSLEIVLYMVVAALAGYLSDLEARGRAKLQSALEEQQKLTGQLVRAGRLSALGEVVAGLAHEVKNPLHTLAGTAEIIDPLIPRDVEERRMWEIHRSEIERLQRVSERFLSFARPDPPRITSLDLRQVAERLIQLVSAEARQKGIDITVVSTEPVWVEGDLDQLVQVGLNIALNGIKAIGDRKGLIRLTTGHQQTGDTEQAFLRIENNGPPIPAETIEHMFDPFYSSSDSTGLGLSISARIAEAHGGQIDVRQDDSQVAFTLYLPSTGKQSAGELNESQ